MMWRVLLLVAMCACSTDEPSLPPSTMTINDGAPITFASSYIEADAEFRSWWLEGRMPAAGAPTERIYTVLLLSSAYNGIETSCRAHYLKVEVETGGIMYTADSTMGTCQMRPIQGPTGDGYEQQFEIVATAIAPGGASVEVVSIIYDHDRTQR